MSHSIAISYKDYALYLVLFAVEMTFLTKSMKGDTRLYSSLFCSMHSTFLFSAACSIEPPPNKLFLKYIQY